MGGIMDDLVERLVSRIGMSEAQARGVVDIVLTFLSQEASPEAIAKLRERMPGLPLAPSPRAAECGEDRHFGGMARLMDIADRMMGLGLTMPDVQASVREVVNHARERAGEECVDEVVRSVPGLRHTV